MPKKTNQQSLTLNDFQRIIIPAMEKIFATKKDLEKFLTKEEAAKLFFTKDETLKFFATKLDLEELRDDLKAEMAEKFDKVLSRSDRIIKDLDTLKTEYTVSNYQKVKERKILKMTVDALFKYKMLSVKQFKQVEAMNLF